jgi:hypothetical protein
MGNMLVHAFSVGSADDVWAVASEDRTGGWGVWHWDGRAWTRWHTEIIPFGLAAVGGGEVWGAAGGSVVHRRVPAAP